ncbi:MAG: flagellar biosynthetic protein FliO [Firmicutes bacterium]|nr:flagellar biosynthetic protein FliO [Bacillota bacterium]
MERYLLILKTIVFLGVVGLLAYLVIKYGLRRFQPGSGREHIKIIQRVPLDLKGGISLLLVRIGEQVLLLGASQGGITVLQELPADFLDRDPPDRHGSEPVGGVFSKILARYKEGIKSGREGS